MSSTGSGTIWSVKLRCITGATLGAKAGARWAMIVLLVVLVMMAEVGQASVVTAQPVAAPLGTVDNSVPPSTEPDPPLPPVTEPPLPPETTTTTVFVPPSTVDPTPPPTFTPATTTSIAPSTSTTRAPDSSVVADDRTVVDPAPGVVGPDGGPGSVINSDTGNGWWTAGTRLRLAVGGLGGLAMVVSVLTLLYWRHTKPDLTLGGTADSPAEPE
jgi:hypothetical protein